MLPKLHILKDHTVPWLERWSAGAGLMGEQGAESLHAHIRNLEDKYATIPNEVDRLKYMFQMYELETEPTLLSLKPEIKGRKKSEE